MSGHPQSAFAQFPFGGGMDQNVDSRLLDLPKVISAQNVRTLKAGTYTKRYGTSTDRSALAGPSWLSWASTIYASGPQQLSAVGDALIRADGKTISSRVAAYSSLEFLGLCPLGTPRTRQLWGESGDSVDEESRLGQCDIAVGTTSGGQTVVAVAYYNDENAETRVIVYDASTWSPINVTKSGTDGGPMIAYAAHEAPRLMWMSNDLYILMVDSSANLVLKKFASSTWAESSVATVVSGGTVRRAAGQSFFDVATVSGTTFVVAWQDTAFALKVREYTAATTTTVWTTTSAEPAAAVDAIGVSATSAESVWITYVVHASLQTRVSCLQESNGTERASFPKNASAVLPAMPLCSGSARLSSSEALLVWSGFDDTPAAASDVAITYAQKCNTSATLGSYKLAPACVMAAKPFVHASRAFIPVVHGGAGRPSSSVTTTVGVQWSLGLFEVFPDYATNDSLFSNSLMVPYTATAPRNVWSMAANVSAYAPCSSVYVGTTWYYAWPEITGVDGYLSLRERLVLASHDTSGSAHLKAAQLGGAGYAAGLVIEPGCVREHGFIHRPEKVYTANNGAGNVANGDYYYKAVYTAVTRAGRVVRSAPSEASTLHTVSGGSKQVTVSVPAPAAASEFLPHMYGQAQIFVDVYRTAASSSGPYYWTARGALTRGATYVDITDNHADATIASSTQLYTGDVGTQRSANANTCAPTFVHTAAHKGRIFGIWPDRRTVQFTSLHVDGELPHVHSEFTMRVDDDLVALASMDEALYAFSATGIYRLFGEGPSDRFGELSDYAGFVRIASDVGCADANSVCVTPFGIVFRTSLGLSVLRRNGAVEPFGLEVQDELDTYSSFTSIVLHPSKRWLYVACDNGTNGVRLVFDYRYGTWAKDTLRLSQASDRIRAQCAVGSTLYMASGADGYVYKEDSTTYLDVSSTWVTASVAFAPFKAAGAQGFQGVTSFHFLGERHTAHGLTIAATFNHGTTSETKSWTDSQLSAFANSPVIQWRRNIVTRENEAVALTLSDTTPTVGSVGTGRGSTWVAFGFDHEPKRGPFPLPAGQQV